SLDAAPPFRLRKEMSTKVTPLFCLELGAGTCSFSGGPGQSRTADQRFRKPLLYPSELQGLNQGYREPLFVPTLTRSAERKKAARKRLGVRVFQILIYWIGCRADSEQCCSARWCRFSPCSYCSLASLAPSARPRSCRK